MTTSVRWDMWLRPPRLRSFRGGERHATWLELFFDLCFVVAVAAVASDLHHDPTWSGIGRFVGLFVIQWWAWGAFTWYATAYDTDDLIFRLAAFAAMLAVIALAANVHRVSEDDSAPFVLSFVAIKLLITGLWLRAARAAAGAERTFCRRYAIGFSLAIAIWLGSLLVPAPARYWVWALAMVVELSTAVWAVRTVQGLVYDTAHIPERYGLFTIIVLGEAIFAVAAGTGEGEWRAVSALTASFCFVLAVSLWWAYFAYFGRMTIGRGLPVWVWGYGHVFIFASIAAAGVGSELAIEAALAGHGLDAAARWIFCSGAALFVLAFTVVQLATHVGVLRSTVVLRGLLIAWQIVLALVGGGLSAPLFAFLVMLPGFLLTAYVVARIGMPAPDD